ncbi:MAG: hypothetical protein ACD_33C00036G0003 [uncultured bacterium]|nr:MAG: hypothetical protein ACD_33C00036G0003 [uncultured bacterium]
MSLILQKKLWYDQESIKERKKMNKHFIAYVDGSCRANPGYAGYGVYGYIFKESTKSKNIKHPTYTNIYFTELGFNKEKSINNIEVLDILEVVGSINDHTSTNNTAELIAVITALKLATELLDIEHVTILTDSNYIVTAYSDNLDKWINNGWKNTNNKEIVHIAEWKYVYLLLSNLKEKNITVNINWIKGHSGDHGNDTADLYSVIGSNAARVQLNSPDASKQLFNKSIFYKVSTYDEYRKSTEVKDFTLHFKELYFSSSILNDVNYCFLSNSDKVHMNIGKKSTDSIFAINIGFIPEFINKIKEFYRSKERNYATTCCMKLSKLVDKNKLRLFNFIDVNYLLVKTGDNYSLPNDTSPFVFDLLNDFPLITNINTTFGNIKDIYDCVSQNLVNENYFLKDITDLFIKDNKLLFTNKDSVIDLSSILLDSNINTVIKQKLLVNIGYDLPNYLAMKQIEDKILKIHVIIERNRESNLASCFFRIITTDREIYVTNITNKFLIK